MNFSNGENLILLMLADLYEHFDIKGETNAKLVKAAIISKNSWAMPMFLPWMDAGKEPIPEIATEVMDILDMWGCIESSYKKLSETDRKKLEKDASPFGKNPIFRGFDGNHEPEYLSIASFLIEDLGRFQQFKGRELNSHSPSTKIYQRMLLIFNKIQEALTHNPMTIDQLISLLNAKKCPRN